MMPLRFRIILSHIKPLFSVVKKKKGGDIQLSLSDEIGRVQGGMAINIIKFI